ncbi:hypothetical protein SAY86_001624 [Trapa natans]|uniref:Uncharacterized protein n=1 Tax=Trapa natans TaxID=22666 RepID=A0AAN7LGG4_TRANT|nr:hypothetical protein SAY86_001624 [Trapa natans]
MPMCSFWPGIVLMTMPKTFEKFQPGVDLLLLLLLQPGSITFCFRIRLKFPMKICILSRRTSAGFVSCSDTQAITKHVTWVADVEVDALIALYKKLWKEAALQNDKTQFLPGCLLMMILARKKRLKREKKAKSRKGKISEEKTQGIDRNKNNQKQLMS